MKKRKKPKAKKTPGRRGSSLNSAQIRKRDKKLTKEQAKWPSN